MDKSQETGFVVSCPICGTEQMIPVTLRSNEGVTDMLNSIFAQHIKQYHFSGHRSCVECARDILVGLTVTTDMDGGKDGE